MVIFRDENPRGREALIKYACGIFLAERCEQSAIASTAVLFTKPHESLIAHQWYLKRTPFVGEQF